MDCVGSWELGFVASSRRFRAGRRAAGEKTFFPGRKSGQGRVKTISPGKQPRLRLVLLPAAAVGDERVGETTSSDGRLEKREGGGACEEA